MIAAGLPWLCLDWVANMVLPMSSQSEIALQPYDLELGLLAVSHCEFALEAP